MASFMEHHGIEYSMASSSGEDNIVYIRANNEKNDDVMNTQTNLRENHSIVKTISHADDNGATYIIVNPSENSSITTTKAGSSQDHNAIASSTDGDITYILANSPLLTETSSEDRCKVEVIEVSTLEAANFAYESGVTLEENSGGEESGVLASCLADHEYMDQNEEFHLLSGGSKRGSDMLFEKGYSYNKDGKPNKNGGQRWRCSVRSQSNPCNASLVIHKDNSIVRSSQSHACSPKNHTLPDQSLKLICSKVTRKPAKDKVSDKVKYKKKGPVCICEKLNTEGYHVIIGGSMRGADKLVEKGYSYLRKAKIAKTGYQLWRCSVRNKNLICPATIIQSGDNFVKGSKPHLCLPKQCKVHSELQKHRKISSSMDSTSQSMMNTSIKSDIEARKLCDQPDACYLTDDTPNIAGETLTLRDDDGNEFMLVFGGTSRGGDKLIHKGFSYVKDGKPTKSGHQRWRCPVRNKNIFCHASIIQKGDSFLFGNNPHCCTPSEFVKSPEKKNAKPSKRQKFVETLNLSSDDEEMMDESLVDESVNKSFDDEPCIKNSESSCNTSLQVTTFKQGFQLITGGSRRGNDKLVEKGFSYVKDNRKSHNSIQRWRCSVRNKSICCPAAVLQNGDTFTRGPQPHRCFSRFRTITPNGKKNTPRAPRVKKEDATCSSNDKEGDKSEGSTEVAEKPDQEEPELDEPVPDFDSYKDKEFIIVPGGSSRGADILIENGYKYVKDGHDCKHYQRWRCTVRNKDILCLASIKQQGDKFTKSPKPHKCTPKEGALASALVKAQIRKLAKCRPDASGTTIVKDSLKKLFANGEAAFSIPSIPTLIRSTNYKRQKNKMLDPKDLSYQWVTSSLPPGFVQDDIYVGNARHVVMHTPGLLSLLAKAENWYVDGTVKAVPQPFQYLLSIHVYAEHNNEARLVPVCMIFMSRKMKRDYVEVLQAIIDELPEIIALNTVVMDFEIAAWGAFCQFFPGAHLRGSLFHWEEAVTKKLKSFDLSSVQKKKITTKFLQKMMCLPFLPAEEIPAALDTLQDQIEPSYPVAFQELMDYMDSMWMSGSIWKPNSWSIFGIVANMDDELEHWHEILDDFHEYTVKQNLGLYDLIELMHKESELVGRQCQPISQEEVECYHHANCGKVQNDVFGIWDQFNEGVISSETLLEKVSRLYKFKDL